MFPKIVIICGTTGSGKTSLALDLANSLPAVSIISADSRQAYHGLDHLTGKDVPDDFHHRPSTLTYQNKPVSYLTSKSINIWGVDFIRPDQDLNLSHFVSFAWQVAKQELKAGRQIIVVGGTGLYLKAFSHFSPQIHVPPNLVLRRKLEKLSISSLQENCEQLDPQGFSSLNNSDLNNARRLIRRIELATSGANQSLPDYYDLQHKSQYRWVGLQKSRELLKEAIDNRVEARLRSGAINEVADLLSSYPNLKLPIYSSLGVPQILAHLRGELSKSELSKLWSRSELAYAKRQQTWFNKQPNIIWYDNTIDRGLIVNQTKEWLLENQT